MIKLVDIHKKFSEGHEEVHALRGISLHVEKGDVYGIIGLSGAGKSTLVRCINFLERPTSGNVIVAGDDLSKLSDVALREKRKKIGMIFQNFNLLKSKTVFENIAFPLMLDKVDKAKIQERVMELLRLVELEDKAKMYPSQLSGGQKQRVGIARALANHPDILLCDEATSALDPKTTTQILNLLKKINREYGITMVVITHEMQVIKTICNKVSILEYGQVIDQGDVIDVFSKTGDKKSSYFLDEAHDIDFSGMDEHVLKLIFVEGSAKQPLLSLATQKFGVNFNIIFGKVEQIQDRSLGRLLVSTGCDKSKLEEIIEFFREHSVNVEVING